MEKLLTVTVPAYNADRWLEYNLDSLLLPSCLDMLEVLVVDDGSVDRTGEIADSYAARCPDTVRVIHKENGGHGSGVNTGIKEARGRYFKVVDADDWVDQEKRLYLIIHTIDRPGQLMQINNYVDKMQLKVKSIKVKADEDEIENEETRQLYVELDVFNYKSLKGAEIIEALRNIPGVTSVNIT